MDMPGRCTIEMMYLCSTSAESHQLLSLSSWGRVSIGGLRGSLNPGMWGLRQVREKDWSARENWQEVEE